MRIIVVGTSGSGKSTFAEALASRLHVPRVELDALHWLPNWTERDRGEFRALVAQATEGDRWVVDGNYSAVRDVLWPRATDIVWLNFSRATVFSRVFTRTVRRCWTKEELWAGNRESWRKAFLSRKSILLWSLTTYSKNRMKYARLRNEPGFAHLRWHELRAERDAQYLLRSVNSGTSLPWSA
jgi:adenylate kinase family enzyme